MLDPTAIDTWVLMSISHAQMCVPESYDREIDQLSDEAVAKMREIIGRVKGNRPDTATIHGEDLRLIVEATLRECVKIMGLGVRLPIFTSFGTDGEEEFRTLNARLGACEEALRGRDEELLRIRTTQTNAAVELEKVRYWLGIAREPDRSAEVEVRRLVEANRGNTDRMNAAE